MERINIRPGNIVFDMDEVLFNISPYVYKKMKMNWSVFLPFLNNLGPLTDEDVLNRKYFEVTKWLIKDCYADPNKDLNKVIHETVYRHMKDLCFTEDMYDNLTPTQLCKQTLLSDDFMSNPAIESCTILTRYPITHPSMLKAKEKTFDRYFAKNRKIKLVTLTSEEKKSDALKKLGIDWSLFIDDEIPNIRDFAENFDLNRREFLLPKCGYNHPFPPELRLLIMEKGGTFSYYTRTI